MRMSNALFVRIQYTGDLCNYMVVMAEHSAAKRVSASFAEKKRPASYVVLPFLQVRTRGHAAVHVRINIGPAFVIKLDVHAIKLSPRE